ncbi:putative bifunctional diguanylate cyclase/phosphodiesterase [Piscinibacter gummiphilus]|uniref:Uncharacterized protein n=1 Tax=Piscinibacter gummiphilus TaxID=946333 RepID=A0A1W6LDP6_9BURK|nr:bifunctional diguanylate cyclase/phosphodiesterase [Piscinibacter gummiphilus]ARN22382.1 hypothetical protein A4W93_22110 [Piscinibacter gummiphilus]ATU67075.1 bifunctional diguanylate cyclase/phosphodiesterase [Piscinibacter gummiphilus]GLS97955.1 hypothetical protein GCM10007918_52470 [Piscinibacter gummiphilus]
MNTESRDLPSLVPSTGDRRWAGLRDALQVVGRIRWSAKDERIEACADTRRLLRLPAGDRLELVPLVSLIRRGRLGALRKAWLDAVSARQPQVVIDVPLVHDGGVHQHVRIAVAIDYGPNGEPLDCEGALHDITEHQLLIERLQIAERRLDEAQELAHVGHWEWDFARSRAKYSDQARRIIGLPDGAAPDLQQFARTIPDEQRPAIVDGFTAALAQRQPTFRYAYHATGTDGRRRDFHGVVKVLYNRGRAPRQLLGTIQDVTELSAYRERLHALSNYDPLTQLPNRSMFVDRTRTAMADAARDGKVLGVLMLDLDQFKHVNESLGHASGDELIKQAAQRLTSALRDHDTVARPGGDEFAVLLPAVRAAVDLDLIANKLLRAFESPFRLLNRDVFVTTSIGAALFPADADHPDQLVLHADAALSEAKARGRNNVRFYSPQLTAQASARLALETELRQAVDQDQLVLHFQPKFDLASGDLVGAEALMRWNHPARGMVSPVQFIPVAEETGLIVPMGAWALHQACRAAVTWNQRPAARQVKVAVNLSARQFATGQLVETVCEALSSTGCLPQWLELEITESLLIDKRSNVREDLETLAALGVTIALDDFGTGYSALSYLTHFPVHTLKIDRSFVKDLPGDRQSGELVKAIVSLGRSLNMELVAEGVETDEQSRLLAAIGCHMAQGFLLGRPVPQDQFEALLG